MNVKAAPGIRVPHENNPLAYIDDSVIVSVAESAYYSRRVADGDLIVIKEEKNGKS